TRLLLKGKLEGIGWFTYENFERITKQHPEHQFFFLFDRPYSDDFIFASNVTPIILKPQSRHPILWYIWFEWAVEKFLKKHKIDIFVSPDGYLSLKTDIPQLAVIHDINFYHNPKGLPLITSWYFNKYFPKFAYKAKRIVTVSEYSKTDIVNCYKIDEKKIDVVYNGANIAFSPISEDEATETRVKISGGTPYFVFVGAFNPRKNVDGLIKAYSIFREKTNSNIKLVLVGEPMFKTKAIQNAFNHCPFKDDIIFTGRREINELRSIIGASFAMVYPSFFEGFGIPVLEAIKCEVPLAVSNTTSIPEVAGNAAIYFDPSNIDSIADSMVYLWSNESLRNELIKNAKMQGEQFNWDISAVKLYDSIMRSLE
ncbi:MAG TPA: glycosyltransferase family 1 protein, partial [Tenuifilaceae bacterium]|nr:glycosyltransferase family 1 protein [Tenuifilaceae bacterium]